MLSMLSTVIDSKGIAMSPCSTVINSKGIAMSLAQRQTSRIPFLSQVPRRGRGRTDNDVIRCLAREKVTRRDEICRRQIIYRVLLEVVPKGGMNMDWMVPRKAARPELCETQPRGWQIILSIPIRPRIERGLAKWWGSTG